MAKPKFQIGETVYNIWGFRYEVAYCRWDDAKKRRSFEMEGPEPGFQYQLKNGRWEDNLRLKDGTTNWVDECYLFSAEEVEQQQEEERREREEDPDLYNLFEDPDDAERSYLDLGDC